MMALRMAHRGARGYAPENSLEAFAKAIELNCDGIELDVQLSADREAIVMHDDTIDRTAQGTGRVSDFTSSELQGIKLRDSSEHISTLADVLAFIDGRCLLNIEIKAPLALPAVLNAIDRAKNWSRSQFLISSFDLPLLLDVQRAAPDLKLGALTEEHIDDAFGFAAAHGLYSVHPEHNLLKADDVLKIQSAGLRIFAWTVNEHADINRVRLLGVDGIISDFPDRI